MIVAWSNKEFLLSGLNRHHMLQDARRSSYERLGGTLEDISRLRGVAELAENGQRISELLANIEARLSSAQQGSHPLDTLCRPFQPCTASEI